MNRDDRDTTRIVRSWLEEGATVVPDRVLDAVEAQLHATPQRRTSPLARALAFMSHRSARYGLAAAVLVAAALFGASFLPGNQGSLTTPPLTTPTPTPPGEARTLPRYGTDLEPGRYVLRGILGRISFTVPDGFDVCSDHVAEQSVCAQPSSGVSFSLIENVVADPCSEREMVDPPAGRSVDALVEAIAALDGFEATPAQEITIDGYRGKRLTVIAPRDTPCQLRTWATSDRVNGVSHEEVNELIALDVHGDVVLIALAYRPGGLSSEDLDAMRGIVESVRIEP